MVEMEGLEPSTRHITRLDVFRFRTIGVPFGKITADADFSDGSTLLYRDALSALRQSAQS
jgi:hypothetical protein